VVAPCRDLVLLHPFWCTRTLTTAGPAQRAPVITMPERLVTEAKQETDERLWMHLSSELARSEVGIEADGRRM
ncbi:hypothetical protein ACIBG0_42210, partial [Nocardia sp. NPDC050630]|uniref:hypothetical protein n=1 Tax=Nocardia sp. NPDC050630 TaxID=3364321 RepID=UPI0037913BE8